MNAPRAYLASDHEAYEAMLRRGRGTLPAPGRHRWKYESHADSARWVIDDGGELVGHTGFVAFVLQVADRDTLAGTSGDAFTDVRHRGAGVYSKLSRHADEVLGERASMQFAWFHDGWSGFQKGLGWRHLGRLEWRRALVAPFRAAVDHVGSRGRRVAAMLDRRLWRAPATAGQLRAAIAAAPELDQAWAHVAGRWPLSVRRDAAWFAWRAREPARPSEVHVMWDRERPVGVIAFRIEQGRYGARGLLLDASFAPDAPEVAAALVTHATATLAERGAHHVAALAVPGSVWDTALAHNGLRSTGLGYDLGVRPYGELPNAPPSAWAITGAEGDST